MFKRLQTWIWRRLIHWLETEGGPAAMQSSDFERLRFEVKPCDVVLVGGCSRISRMIKTLTLSGWTHAALHVGRLHDIEDFGSPPYFEIIKYPLYAFDDWPFIAARPGIPRGVRRCGATCGCRYRWAPERGARIGTGRYGRRIPVDQPARRHDTQDLLFLTTRETACAGS
jgi:hypothetical protein